MVNEFTMLSKGKKQYPSICVVNECPMLGKGRSAVQKKTTINNNIWLFCVYIILLYKVFKYELKLHIMNKEAKLLTKSHAVRDMVSFVVRYMSLPYYSLLYAIYSNSSFQFRLLMVL